MRYSVLLFDLDNTLLDFNKAEEHAFFMTAKNQGVTFTKADYDEYHKINDKWWKLHEKGLYSRDEIVLYRYAEFFKLKGVNLSPEKFNADYMINLGEGKFTVNGAEEVLKTLKIMGAQIYVVTNGVVSIQNRRLKNNPVTPYIDGMFVSEKIGVPKPDVRFFKAAEEEFGIRFDDKTLIIGDSLTSDIAGGKNAGIKTCWFNPRGTANDSAVNPDYEIKNLFDVLKVVSA